MGVPQIWDIIRNSIESDDKESYYYRRVGLKQYLVEHQPVIAIDAYHILFECGFFQFDILGKPMLNLMKRIKELVSLDVTFILVFDGLEKPLEKSQMNRIYKSHPKSMKDIAKLLKLLQISTVQAPGEGETQCCLLESQGKVDTVWSNDSDCLLFGGNHIMKNFSKNIDDVGVNAAMSPTNSPRKGGSDRGPTTRENFITVLSYNELLKERSTNLLDRESLLLFSVLLGADYNEQGVKGLGKDKCYKLASLKDPNFSHEFYEIFKSIDDNDWDIQFQYEQFQKRLFIYCKDNSVKLFGKNYAVLLKSGNDNFDNWPPISAVKHYFHPVIDSDVDIGEILDPGNFSNIHKSLVFNELDFESLKLYLKGLHLPQITDFDKWFHETMHEMYLLKYILYDTTSSQKCKITEQKSVSMDDNINFEFTSWKIRYNTFLKGVEPSLNASPKRSNSPQRSPTKRQIDIQEYNYAMWLPRESIPETHPLVVDYKKREMERLKQEEHVRQLKTVKRKNSKKRFQNYSQKNTLDSFFDKHTVKIDKNIASINEINHIQVTKTASPSLSKFDVLKKRLFVDTDDEGKECDDNDVGNDSSLIILDEKMISEEKKTGNRLDFSIKFSQTDNMSIHGIKTKTGESPTKKQHIEYPNTLPFLPKQTSFNDKVDNWMKAAAFFAGRDSDDNDDNEEEEFADAPSTVSPIVSTRSLNKPVPVLTRSDTFERKDLKKTDILSKQTSFDGVTSKRVNSAGLSPEYDHSDNTAALSSTVSPVVSARTLDKPVPILTRTDTFQKQTLGRTTSLLDNLVDDAHSFFSNMKKDGNESDASTASIVSSSSLGE